jgi:hypothetical protein
MRPVKFSWGGGDVVCHSSVFACHGLLPAGRPAPHREEEVRDEDQLPEAQHEERDSS